jgi:hypothetical protein
MLMFSSGGGIGGVGNDVDGLSAPGLIGPFDIFLPNPGSLKPRPDLPSGVKPADVLPADAFLPLGAGLGARGS